MNYRGNVANGCLSVPNNVQQNSPDLFRPPQLSKGKGALPIGNSHHNGMASSMCMNPLIGGMEKPMPQYLEVNHTRMPFSMHFFKDYIRLGLCVTMSNAVMGFFMAALIILINPNVDTVNRIAYAVCIGCLNAAAIASMGRYTGGYMNPSYSLGAWFTWCIGLTHNPSMEQHNAGVGWEFAKVVLVWVGQLAGMFIGVACNGIWVAPIPTAFSWGQLSLGTADFNGGAVITTGQAFLMTMFVSGTIFCAYMKAQRMNALRNSPTLGVYCVGFASFFMTVLFGPYTFAVTNPFYWLVTAIYSWVFLPYLVYIFAPFAGVAVVCIAGWLWDTLNGFLMDDSMYDA